MGLNSGIIFGTIMRNGNSFSGVPARVSVNWIKGDLSQPELHVTQKENQTHSKAFVDLPNDTGGKYILPFNWDGVQIATVLQGALTVSLLGIIFDPNGAPSQNVRARAFLCLDLKALISQAYPTFDNPTQEAFDIAKDFITSFREILPKFQTVVPHNKIFLSTEIWSIMAKVDINIPA